MKMHHFSLLCASVLLGTFIQTANTIVPPTTVISSIRTTVASSIRNTMLDTTRKLAGSSMSSTKFSTLTTIADTPPSSSTTVSTPTSPTSASTFPTTTPTAPTGEVKLSTILRTSSKRPPILKHSSTTISHSSTRFSTKATPPSTPPSTISKSSPTSTTVSTPTTSSKTPTTPTTPTTLSTPSTPERTPTTPSTPTTLSTPSTPKRTPTTPATLSTSRKTPTTPTTPSTTSTIPTTPSSTPSTPSTPASTTLSTSTTTEQAERVRVAFTATRESGLNVSANPLIMSDVLNTNLNDRYSLTTDKFTAPAAGFYYNMICAGLYPTDMLIVRTKGATPQLGLIRQHKLHLYPDSQCRSGISQLNAGSVVNLASEGPRLYCDQDHQTQWSMFSISDSMSEPSAFSAYRSESYSTLNAYVSFTEVFDEDSAFDAAVGLYTCPVNGIYLFSVTIALGAGATLRLQLTSNSHTMELTRTSTAHNALDTISRPVLLPCQAGETVGLKLLNGVITGDSTDMLSSFAGFRYNPRDVSQVAWSAYRSSSWRGTSIFKSLDPVEFDQVIVNEGNAFSNNEITIPVSGYYYIAVTSGAQASTQVNMDFYVNGIKIVDVYRHATYHNGEDTLSKEFVLRLKQNDNLWIVANAATSIYSDAGLQTSFIGMLLYSE